MRRATLSAITRVTNGPEFVEDMRDSEGIGSGKSAGKWATTEHSKTPKAKKVHRSGRPKGWAAPLTATVESRANFEWRMGELVKNHPEIAARLQREANRRAAL